MNFSPKKSMPVLPHPTPLWELKIPILTLPSFFFLAHTQQGEALLVNLSLFYNTKGPERLTNFYIVLTVFVRRNYMLTTPKFCFVIWRSITNPFKSFFSPYKTLENCFNGFIPSKAITFNVQNLIKEIFFLFMWHHFTSGTFCWERFFTLLVWSPF